jgi:hypothetical protein
MTLVGGVVVAGVMLVLLWVTAITAQLRSLVDPQYFALMRVYQGLGEPALTLIHRINSRQQNIRRTGCNNKMLCPQFDLEDICSVRYGLCRSIVRVPFH